jgi:uncharacterized protein (DUF1697 family)
MPARIALLRGVNVAGAGKLPMAAFREALTGLGLTRVATYIQSGNGVFESDLATDTLEPMIRKAVGAGFGFTPETCARWRPCRRWRRRWCDLAKP